MSFSEKVGVTAMLGLLALGLLFVRNSGRWRFHEINPIRILLAREDGQLRPLAKPVIWGLIAAAVTYIWLFVATK